MTRKIIFLIILFWALCGTMPVRAAASGSEPEEAAVTYLRGQVYIQHGGGYAQTAAYRGMELKAGDVLITGPDSTVIVTGYRKEMVLGENTKIAVGELWNRHERDFSSVTLVEGTVKNRVDLELNNNSWNTIRTSNMLVGIRGTEYVLVYSRMGWEDYSDENPYLRLRVIDGEVRFDLTGIDDTESYLVSAAEVRRFTEDIQGERIYFEVGRDVTVPLEEINREVLQNLYNDPRAEDYHDEIEVILAEDENRAQEELPVRPDPGAGIIYDSEAEEVLPTLPRPTPEILEKGKNPNPSRPPDSETVPEGTPGRGTGGEKLPGEQESGGGTRPVPSIRPDSDPAGVPSQSPAASTRPGGDRNQEREDQGGNDDQSGDGNHDADNGNQNNNGGSNPPVPDPPVFDPPLEGTASLSGTNRIGSVLTVLTDDIRGGSGVFRYQWQADGIDTGYQEAQYPIRGTDAGKVISCVVSREKASGTIRAEGEEIPFELRVVNIGNTGVDTPVTLSAETGVAGAAITLNYALGNDGKANHMLAFTGVTGLNSLNGAGQSTSQSYTVNRQDGADGYITIVATFAHTDLKPDTIAFSDNQNESRIYGDLPYTKKIVQTGQGQGSVTYTSNNTALAGVDAVTGEVTVKKPGTVMITARKASDGVYSETSTTYTLTIGKKLLIPGIGLAGVQGKTYDGTPAIAGTQPTVILTGGVREEQPEAAAVFTFADHTAGTGKNIIARNIILRGTWGDYYELENLTVTAGSGVAIRPKPITVAGVTAESRVYDGTTNVLLTGGTLQGVEAGDTVGFSLGTGRVLDGNAGADKPVTTSVSLTGADAGNYVLSQPELRVEIRPSPIDSAAITVTPPVVGAVPDTTASGSGNFSIGAVTWSPSAGTFQPGTTYTASVTLTADSNYEFATLLYGDATVNGKPVQASNNGGTLTLSDAFTTPFPLTMVVGNPEAVSPIADVRFTVTISGYRSSAHPYGISVNGGGAYYVPNDDYTNGTISYTVTVTQPLTVQTVSVVPYLPNNINYYYAEGPKSVSLAAASYEEEGTALSPISVNEDNIVSFNKYANTVEGVDKHFLLTEDVDMDVAVPSTLAAGNWTPIAPVNPNTTSYMRFEGTFDGGGHRISNIKIYYSGDALAGQGMFRNIGASGIVKNLSLDGLYIDGSNSCGGITARIIGGTVQNCFVSGKVAGEAGVGGIAGTNSGGVVENCYSAAEIEGIVTLGGIVGSMNEVSVVRYCISTGKVTAGTWGINMLVGGIAGDVEAPANVQNCVALNPAVISQNPNSVGRMIGQGTGSNLYARFDMGGSTANFTAKNENDKDGQDITATEWNDLSWWQSKGFTAPWWNGKLPPTVPAALFMPVNTLEMSRNHMLTVTAEDGGKVSADGASWSDYWQEELPDGSMIIGMGEDLSEADEPKTDAEEADEEAAPVGEIGLEEDAALDESTEPAGAEVLTGGSAAGPEEDFAADFTEGKGPVREPVMIWVMPEEGYEFVGWRAGEEMLPETDGEYCLVLTEDATLTAVFQPEEEESEELEQPEPPVAILPEDDELPENEEAAGDGNSGGDDELPGDEDPTGDEDPEGDSGLPGDEDSEGDGELSGDEDSEGDGELSGDEDSAENGVWELAGKYEKEK